MNTINALANSVHVPKLWKRYVDDILVIWSHNKEHLETFLSHLNNIHPSIQFTVQLEDDQNSLPFLDILLTRKHDGNYIPQLYPLFVNPWLTVPMFVTKKASAKS
jgi:hypothetical protein